MKPSFVFLLFLLGVAGHGATALGQSPGTFTATGGTTTPRSKHTATILTNGKVLIAGGDQAGFNNSAQTATTELYDPDSGLFTPTGGMTMPRAWHTATLLPDGRVLIAGGRTDAGQAIYAKSAEISDPSTGTFAATGNMISGHECHQAKLLGNGKVLILGGSGAELYDSSNGAFTRTGSTMYLGYNYGLPTATLLLNGKVLVAGGAAEGGGFYVGAELFDPSTGTFTRTGDMTTARPYGSANLLPDGTVLMAGTFLFGSATLASAELYDPVRGAFMPTADMITPRCCHTATLLNDGRVLIVGGGLPELYNPSVIVPAPALLSVSGDRQGQGAILHAGTARVVTASDPVIPGEVVEIYGTVLKEGSVIPPQIAIGGRLAEIQYFGKAPGFSGLNQANVRVPSGIAPGPAVSVRLTYLGRPSNEVTIGVR